MNYRTRIALKRGLQVLALVALVCFILISATGCGMVQDATAPCTVNWNSGVIDFGADPVNITAYYGDRAETIRGANEDTAYYFITEVEDLAFAEFNEQGILETDMVKYEKALTYSQYMSTKVTMALSVAKNTYYVGQIMTNGFTATPKEQLQHLCYEAVKNMILTKGQITVCVNGKMNVTSTYMNPTVTPDGVLYKNTLKITQATDPACTEMIVITQGKKQFTLYKASGKTDKYQYGDILITATSGLNLSDYITFLE